MHYPHVASNMIALVSDYGISVQEVPDLPVHSNHVYVSPIEVAFNGIENAVYLGLLWLKPKTILGSMGIVRVIDVGVDVDQGLKGKTFTVSPFSPSSGGIGTDSHGIASEAASIPLDALFPYYEDLGDLNVLLPYLSIALQVEEVYEGKRLLVIGSGPLGSLIAELCESCDEVGLMGVSKPYLPSGRVRMVSKIEPDAWDAVFIATLEAWALEASKEFKAVAFPRLTLRWPPLVPPKAIEIASKPRDDLLQAMKSLDRKFLTQFVVRSDTFEGAVPASDGKLVVVDVRRALRGVGYKGSLKRLS